MMVKCGGFICFSFSCLFIFFWFFFLKGDGFLMEVWGITVLIRENGNNNLNEYEILLFGGSFFLL